MCASAWTLRGPRGLPSPRNFMVLGGMKTAFVRPPPRDLGMRGASIVRCGLSCLVDLNSDFYRLCGSLHGLDTFWARELCWINKETTTTTTVFFPLGCGVDSWIPPLQTGVKPVAGLNLLQSKVQNPHAGRTTKFALVKRLWFSELFLGILLSEFCFTVYFHLGSGFMNPPPLSSFKPWKEKPPNRPGAVTWADEASM